MGQGSEYLSREDAVRTYLIRSRVLRSWKDPLAGLALRRPALGFHPLVYAVSNPAFDDAEREDPYVHYIRTGKPDGCWHHRVIRGAKEIPPGPTQLRTAIHGHFHYPELLGEFLKRLDSNKSQFDLYLTTNGEREADTIGQGPRGVGS